MQFAEDLEKKSRIIKKSDIILWKTQNNWSLYIIKEEVGGLLGNSL